MKWMTGLAGILTVLAFSTPSFAATISLADWCFNINGTTATCNGGTVTTVAGFDTTLIPSTNTLGTATFNLTAGLNQFVSIYADYDLEFDALGSFDDFGTVNGTPGAGITYMLADPNDGSLFTAFAANTLNNTNTVDTPAGPDPGPNCCDVGFAMSVGSLNVLAGGSGTVTFTVSTVAPELGFYITQTNQDTLSKIYLSASANIVAPEVTGTPEPSTLVLALGALSMSMAVTAWKRRSSRAVASKTI